MHSNQPWYRRGLRFRCAGCGQCCSGAPGYVWVTKGEIEALAAAVGLEMEQFARRYLRVVGIRFSLVEFPDGDCAFLDTQSRRCTVYRFRPRQCRTWPFWKSNLRTPQTWEEAAHRCPGANRGPVVACHRILASLAIVKV